MSEQPIKTYIINFYATDVNLLALGQYLHDSADIIAYWNYIPLVFCVKSRLSSQELTIKLRSFFPLPYMIAEINPQNINGVLPEAAWTWFYLDHHDKLQRPVNALTAGLSLEELLGLPRPPALK
jgi:hypothetical protein